MAAVVVAASVASSLIFFSGNNNVIIIRMSFLEISKIALLHGFNSGTHCSQDLFSQAISTLAESMRKLVKLVQSSCCCCCCC